jgi:microsomal dipeptidase-like Zn-dependent dipeptidase/gamma-glutamyl-gamma-aminobutyrate hydrolase PuuD
MSYFDWTADYDKVQTERPFRHSKPVVGITGNYGDKGCELADGYYESVLEAGGVPFVIPPFEDTEALLSVLENVDALLLSGGGDINPLFVGEEPCPALHSINAKRDKAELLLVRLAADRQIPVLGICRGIQMMAAALEGSVWQDIGTTPNLIKHSQDLARTKASHTVTVEAGSLLEHIFGERVLQVNSFHHQAVKEPGKHFTVTARSTDGIVEAIESKEYKAMLGVQWHPECFILDGDHCMMPIFQWLVHEASLYQRARKFHHDNISLDSHCDTPMFFDQDIHFGQRDPKILVDLHKMQEGRLDASCMVAYLAQGDLDDTSLREATLKAENLLTQIERMVDENADYVGIARRPDDINSLKKVGKKAIFLGIENGYAIGKEIGNVDHFRQRGVVYMTLCHNGDNDICDSARGTGKNGGVSPFGEEVIRRMNDLGMMVDLSHASEKSFYDALDMSRLPIVCSHSSCRSLCDVPRNLTDEQMRALAQAGGVAQVTLFHGFLKKEGTANVMDAVAHLRHMADVMGVENVGIGTDFDGDGGVPGCASASELINFTRILLENEFGEEDLKGIWGENFLRLMRHVQAVPGNPLQ